jgi:uncharacterized membrane protein (UPF0127 family)
MARGQGVLHSCAILLCAIVVALALPALACGDEDDVISVDGVPTPPYTSPVQFDIGEGGRPLLYVEIVETPEKRAAGLMGRDSLPEDAGMLFVWPDDTASAFWMKDTLVPLSVAFIDSEGVVVHIEDMQPLDETLHHSPTPYRYAVETAQGWFEKHAIEAGHTVRLPGGVD